MKILVIGADGQLGWELCRKGNEEGFRIIPLDLPDFDITNPSQVKKAFSETDASVVINAAAYTAVDKAESEPERAFAVNRDGPANLAYSCAEAGIPLIHISTDYVFDGNKKSPYFETDTVSPLGVYGKSKADGEKEVRKHLQAHIILRTAWLYGVHGHNFVKTILRLGGEKEVLRVVADQYGCPTYAADLAEAALVIADRLLDGSNTPYGTYHYCGRGSTSWHGFAEKIVELAGNHFPLKVKTLEPIKTEEYHTPAKRPADSVLDCSLIKEFFGIRSKPWQESLNRMIERLLSTTDI